MFEVARSAGETAPLILAGRTQRLELDPFAAHVVRRPMESPPTSPPKQPGSAPGDNAAPPFRRARNAALALIGRVAVLDQAARPVVRFARISR